MKILILFCVLAVIEYSVQFTFDQKPLDILTLRVTWPKTKCLDPGKNTCTIDSKVTSWGIHGLWPNYNGGSWPEYCNKSNKFDSNQVKNLLNDLNVLWPNLYSNSDIYSFWLVVITILN
jgi:ribonuclease T2